MLQRFKCYKDLNATKILMLQNTKCYKVLTVKDSKDSKELSIKKLKLFAPVLRLVIFLVMFVK